MISLICFCIIHHVIFLPQSAPSSSWINRNGQIRVYRSKSAWWEMLTFSSLTPAILPWPNWRSWLQVTEVAVHLYHSDLLGPVSNIKSFFSALLQRKGTWERNNTHDDVLRYDKADDLRRSIISSDYSLYVQCFYDLPQQVSINLEFKSLKSRLVWITKSALPCSKNSTSERWELIHSGIV